VTDEKGAFKVTCADQKPGAVVGKHYVVVKRIREGPTDPDARPTPANVKKGRFVPEFYGTARYTPLVVNVTMDQNKYNLDLSSKAQARKGSE